MGGLREIYGRVLPFALAMPLVLAIPLCAELAQHVVEVQLGMYAVGSELTAEAERTRMVFGGAKVLAIFVVLLFALRYWAFEGDVRRAATPTVSMLKGLGIVMLVQIGGELILLGIGRSLAMTLGPDAGRGAVAALTVGPILLWLFVANLLLPWFVGLLTEDRTMSLRRSVDGIRGRMWATFALLLGAYLPPMVVHYALGYGAMGRSGAILWAMLVVDSIVVALIAVILASAYFTIYRRGRDRARPVTATP